MSVGGSWSVRSHSCLPRVPVSPPEIVPAAWNAQEIHFGINWIWSRKRTQLGSKMSPFLQNGRQIEAFHAIIEVDS